MQTAAFPASVRRDEQLSEVQPEAGNNGIVALSTAQVTAFRPYTHYASTGYCSPASTLAWDCGHNCMANPSFEPVASGGDGDLTQFCTCHANWCLVPGTGGR